MATATEFKEKGNKLFSAGQIEEAIQQYTLGIQIDSNNSLLYSNRARCHKILNRMLECYEDADNAIQLDEMNIKAHLLAGSALLEIGKGEQSNKKIEQGIRRLKRAYGLCSSQSKREFEAQLSQYIYRAKKLLYLKNREQEIEQKWWLLQYLQQAEQYNSQVAQSTKDQYLEQLSKFLQPEELKLPNFMICPMSEKILLDPITTEFGNTFDRATFQRHCQTQGQIDPIQNKYLTKPVIPNTTLMQIVEEYLEEQALYSNPWAFEFHPNENYRAIKF